jgi:hypothetical protein
MVEIVGRVACHSEFFHHSPGAKIGGHCHRDQSFQSRGIERVPDDCVCAFGGESLAPKSRGQPPANLDTGREVRFKGRHDEADESRKRMILSQFHRQ